MSATCYDETGKSGTDIPCNPSANISTCCGSSSICVQNLFCIDPWNVKVPGTCTDPNWGTNPNPACPCLPHYLPPPNDTLNYMDSVTFCNDGSYCCGIGNTECCQKGLGNPIIYYGNAGVIPSSSAALSQYYTGVHVSTAVITRTTPSRSATSQSASSLTNSAVTTPTAGSHKGLTTSGKVGVGLGITLGLVALGTAILLYMWNRERRKNKFSHIQPRETADLDGGRIAFAEAPQLTSGWVP